jgi:DNA-binding transcriptional LysR family regulator
VEISLTEVEPEQSLPMVRQGELDLALAFECDLVPLPDGDFEAETLLNEPMLVVLAPGKFGRRDRLDLRCLKDEHWIVPGPGTAIHEFTLRACQIAGFHPQIKSTWTDFQVVQSLAAQGYGVAFVPRLAVSPARPGVAVRHTTNDLHRRVFAAWRRGTLRTPLVNSMLDSFRATAEQAGNQYGNE